MTDFKQITFDEEFAQKYWEGKSNFIARQSNFLRRGMGLFNEQKNYLFLLFGSYWTVKTMDLWVKTGISDAWLLIGLGGLAIIGLIGLLILGRWDLYKAQKATEFINAQHGSITGYQSFNMNVRIVEQNDEIIQLLKDLKKQKLDNVV